METALCLVTACLYGVAIYLLLSRHVIRMLLGILLLGNAVNLTLFTAGRIGPIAPPLIPEGSLVATTAVANPLPQALILTAIVISFSFFTFLLVLAFRTYEDLGTDDTDGMRIAEPEGEGPPPLGY
ncbi:Na+/H+ antiporter subunit C [Aurantimonas sp. Leaf443]|uniref:Na+/H+ antiporter subunit C n=1 Tax=Aurantimonas sp. Leaf443 TaxID=1736378 RepID=UPI0006F4D12B|nr:Na+/H+ antiporter subunit C [Aurantimonas sp. Leaf443]KQT85979.1 cation:proton antiporter [Aurantimonas sp. Leaf443]